MSAETTETTEVVCVKRWFAYDASCPCPPCHAARLRKSKLRRNGRLPQTRSDEAWAVVERMLARGLSVGAIGHTAGLCPRTLSNQLMAYRRNGKHTINRVRAERLIAAEHAPVTKGRVTAIVARRQLQALTALGYSMTELAVVTGIKWQTLHSIRAEIVKVTDASQVVAIGDAYAKLSMTPGTNAVCRRNAARLGWGTPMAWDDIDMADPNARPRGVAGP